MSRLAFTILRPMAFAALILVSLSADVATAGLKGKIEIEPKRDGNTVEVTIKVSAEVKIGKKTVARASHEETEKFDVKDETYTQEREYGPFKIVYTITRNDVCAEGKVKLKGDEVDLGKICK